jgi:hypothetical protein
MKDTPQQPGVKEEAKRRLTFGERIAEGVKRDLAKLEQERAEKDQPSGKDPE